MPVIALGAGCPIALGGVGAGYFDQVHVGHELRAFTGLRPTR
jgi:hypothetical protein